MYKWQFYTTNELKPAGWLRRQLEIQAAGLSGNLDKIWPDVRDSAWIGGDREGWERVPYWLDGFIPLAYLLEDEDMIGRAKKYIDAILAAQNEDGWICPCSEDARDEYDTWAVLLISKVLAVYYECSRDARIPEVLYRVLKNYYCLLKDGTVRLFNWGKARWYEGMIAIRFLYDRHPEAWLLELTQILKTQGTDYPQLTQLWKKPLNWWRQETHIVNLMMMLKFEAVSCDLLGQPYTDQAEALYQVLKTYNGTAVETFTGDECLSGLSPIQGTELCAVVEQMYSYEHLFACTGDPKWAERLEVVAFNALPATISDDMWTHQYDQQSNQIACIQFPGKSIFRTNHEQAHLFGLEPNYGCCTANFNQGWPKFALSAFMHRGDKVISALPIPSQLDTGDLRILLETEYPFENTLTYKIQAKKPFTLQLRLPAFAQNTVINGEATQERSPEFHIQPGETTIRVSFDVTPAFRQRPHGLNTVQWGSLVFSLPIAFETRMHEYVENGVERKFPYCDYELIPQSDWNYAYCAPELQVERRGVGPIPFGSKTPPVVIRTRGCRIPWGYADGYETVCAKIPESLTPISEPTEILLHPYGCAKLRMTELPCLD